MRVMIRVCMAVGILATAKAAIVKGQTIYVGHDKATPIFTKGGSLADRPGLVVQVSQRDKPSPTSEEHAKTTHIWHVIDGEATMIVGGTIVGRKEVRADNFQGTDIEGGQTYHLSKGDVIVIPAGTPHWWKEIPKSIAYYAANVDLAR